MVHGFGGFAEARATTLQMMFQAKEAGEWTLTPPPDGKISLDYYFVLQFTDDRSTLVQSLRQKNQIPAVLVAYAILPANFLDVINQQVRRAAARKGLTSPVKAATILFSLVDT